MYNNKSVNSKHATINKYYVINTKITSHINKTKYRHNNCQTLLLFLIIICSCERLFCRFFLGRTGAVYISIYILLRNYVLTQMRT